MFVCGIPGNATGLKYSNNLSFNQNMYNYVQLHNAGNRTTHSLRCELKSRYPLRQVRRTDARHRLNKWK